MRFRNQATLGATALVLAIGAVTACDDDDPTGPSLSAPTNVQVVLSGQDAEITWNAVSGAQSYTVERSRVGDAAGFSSIATNVTTTSHTDDAITYGVSYLYRVRAVAGQQTSAASNQDELVFASVLSGTIGDGEVRTLDADSIYFLTGTVLVDSGGTLNIPAGTEIRGSLTIQPTALIIRQGGQIFADGTETDPIVFTSSRPAGQRQRGDWGGVVLSGYSICNFPVKPCQGEGQAGPYGREPAILDDNSGRLTYVRFEYVGYEVSLGNELNGLTLNAVGSETEIHHVQSHYGLDDGIEWFGGTVDVQYAVVTGASDDSFDYSTGWQGRGQFWIAQQDPNDADHGFEVDGNEDDPDATPRTSPQIYNVTLVGKEPGTGTAGESTRGMLLRLGTAGEIYNAIVLGFEISLGINDTETYALCPGGELVVDNSIIFDGGAYLDPDTQDDEADCTDLWTNLRQEDPELVAPYNRTAPDWRPVAAGAATTGAATPPNDGFFDTTVDYVGAVDPDGTPWYQGWITTAQN